MVVASFNIRLDTPRDGKNSWQYRKDLANDLIAFHDFDIFGVQEAYKHQLDDICRMEQYAVTGQGRDGGTKGEHSAIIYKKERFTLLQSGDFWYSDTPDKVGKGWDATCCNRICSWGKFKDNLSGKTFFFFNSHFDHQGKVARRESAKLLSAYETSQTPPYGTTGTFHNYKLEGPFERRIDHILHTGNISILKYATLNETPHGRFPSDHYPIMVVAEFY